MHPYEFKPNCKFVIICCLLFRSLTRVYEVNDNEGTVVKREMFFNKKKLKKFQTVLVCSRDEHESFFLIKKEQKLLIAIG